MPVARCDGGSRSHVASSRWPRFRPSLSVMRVRLRCAWRRRAERRNHTCSFDCSRQRARSRRSLRPNHPLVGSRVRVPFCVGLVASSQPLSGVLSAVGNRSGGGHHSGKPRRSVRYLCGLKVSAACPQSLTADVLSPRAPVGRDRGRCPTLRPRARSTERQCAQRPQQSCYEQLDAPGCPCTWRKTGPSELNGHGTVLGRTWAANLAMLPGFGVTRRRARTSPLDHLEC